MSAVSTTASEPLLRSFDREDLAPGDPEAKPQRGDLVEFWLEDGCAGVYGQVAEQLGPERVKVRVDGVGAWSVPIEALKVVRRAQ